MKKAKIGLTMLIIAFISVMLIFTGCPDNDNKDSGNGSGSGNGGSTTTTYKVTVVNAQDGSIIANPSTNVTAGATVTLTITPDSGFQLKSISAIGMSGNNIPISFVDGKRVFKMPASDAIVIGDFIAFEKKTFTLDKQGWGGFIHQFSISNFLNKPITAGNVYILTYTIKSDVTIKELGIRLFDGEGTESESSELSRWTKVAENIKSNTEISGRVGFNVHTSAKSNSEWANNIIFNTDDEVYDGVDELTLEFTEFKLEVIEKSTSSYPFFLGLENEYVWEGKFPLLTVFDDEPAIEKDAVYSFTYKFKSDVELKGGLKFFLCDYETWNNLSNDVRMTNFIPANTEISKTIYVSATRSAIDDSAIANMLVFQSSTESVSNALFIFTEFKFEKIGLSTPKAPILVFTEADGWDKPGNEDWERWDHNLDPNWLFNGDKVEAGNMYTLTYTFTSNIDIPNPLALWLVESRPAPEPMWWFWNNLTPHKVFTHDIKKGVQNSGVFKMFAIDSATSNLPESNQLLPNGTRSITEQPVLIFTQFEFEIIEQPEPDPSEETWKGFEIINPGFTTAATEISSYQGKNNVLHIKSGVGGYIDPIIEYNLSSYIGRTVNIELSMNVWVNVDTRGLAGN
jgi:hypothetical protein